MSKKNPYEDLYYKCTICGAPLQFSDNGWMMYCPKCFANYDRKALDRQINKKLDEIEENIDTMPNWERGFLTEGWKASEGENLWERSFVNGEEVREMKEYTCPSCGAKIVCDDTTVATSCLYCNNIAIIESKLTGEFSPDYIIPFKTDREDAIAAFKKHCQKQPMLPKGFAEAEADVKGIYIPFWIFENSARAHQYYYGRKFSENTAEKNGVNRNEYFHVYRSGEMEFDRIIVDASDRLPYEYIEGVGGYNFDEMKPFSTAFLPGFFAEKYESNLPDMVLDIEAAYEEAIRGEMRKTISDFLEAELKEEKIIIGKGRLSYAMVPVWLIRINWKDKEYTCSINGQTGKAAGSLPVCRKKKAALFTAVAAPVMAVLGAACVYLQGLLPAWSSLLWVSSVLMALFAGYVVCSRTIAKTEVSKSRFRYFFEAKSSKGLRLTEKIDDFDRVIDGLKPKWK